MAPFRVEPSPLGSACAATQPIAQGAVVCALAWGPVSPRPTRWTLQLDAGVHAEPRPPALRYVNHHCDPNVAFDLADGVVRALRAVAAGEALTAFYPATELELAEPFSCACGAPRCVGLVAGAVHLPGAVLAGHALSPLVAAVCGAADDGAAEPRAASA